MDRFFRHVTSNSLGIHLDAKLPFDKHVFALVKRLSKHIIAMRHYVSKHVLLKYYNCYMKPIVLHGILIYGCSSGNTAACFRSSEKIITPDLFQEQHVSLH